MRTQLLSHNKTAYQKVMKAFETSDRTCVVHPTGTGKSYLIAAVSESYNKVLILGPNIFVLDQVHDVLRWRKRGVEYMTYTTLMLTENPHTDYDMICLDEFHRAGAQEWGAAVDRLLELNTQAKVLGTTATHIRYLDNERNMANELFHGNIASHITIAEAWNQSILPIPCYVSGLFRWDKTIGDAKERIERSRSLSAEEKRQRIFRLTNAHLHWELSYGMPAILKKHLDRDASRVIVFCGNIESLEQMRQEVVGWFREAGFTIASTCIMHSDLGDREQREQMKDFESDKEEGVRLMFSVNMLNEGVHVPNVNAVLMLRTTSSRIIYMQQMGRCLTAANTAKPLVLDMVDNITTTTAIKDLRDEFDSLEMADADHEGREPRKFEVKDYTLGVRELIEKLVPADYKVIPYEERLAAVTAFCEKYIRLPGKRDSKDIRMHWHSLCAVYSDLPEVKVLKQKYGKQVIPTEEKIRMMEEFTEKHGRRPNKSEKEPYMIWARMVAARKSDKRIDALCEKYGHKTLSIDESIAMMEGFTAIHGRYPNSSEKELRKVWFDLCRYRGKNHRVDALFDKYAAKKISLEEKIQMMLEFTSQHGRKPNRSEKDLYRLWPIMVQQCKGDERVRAMQEQYCPKRAKPVSFEEKILMMQEYTTVHGHRPPYSDKHLYHIWKKMLAKGKSDPRVQEMYGKYGKGKL